MKTAIEKPVTPGGVFDHLMVPQEDEPEFHPSKDPKTMTVQESLEEVDRFLCWNRMTPRGEAGGAGGTEGGQPRHGASRRGYPLYYETGEGARHPTGHGMGGLDGRSTGRCAS